MKCHHFSPRNPETVQSEWEQLELKVLYNSSDLATTHFNSAQLMIQLTNPSSALSQYNNRMAAVLRPGNSYTLSLEPFTYRDTSGAADCIEQGTEGHLELFDGYSYYGCIEEFYAKAELDACGCVAFFSLLNTRRTENGRDSGLRLCGVLDYFFCGETIIDNGG